MNRSAIFFCGLLLWPLVALADPPDSAQLIQSAVDYWRGKACHTEVAMTIHHPDWQRSPAKNAGNATLKLGQAMWIFTPKLNQIIKLPASMMARAGWAPIFPITIWPNPTRSSTSTATA